MRSHRLILCMALACSALTAGASSALGQFADPTFVLNPSSGGPSDTFTATYDVSQGGCQYADGRMVNFYWYGGSSAITVIGKAPLAKCVASITAAPPAGTPPGEYTVSADVVSPSGPQAEKGEKYRVGAAPRPPAQPTPPSGGSAPGAVVPGAPGGGAGVQQGPVGPSPGQGDAVAVPGTLPGPSDGSAPTAGAAEPSPPPCAMQGVDCRAETPAAADGGGPSWFAVILVVLSGGALLAVLLRGWRRRVHDPERVAV